MEGDTVTAKCVSDLSDPAPILSWYINGHSVSLKQQNNETVNLLSTMMDSVTVHV